MIYDLACQHCLLSTLRQPYALFIFLASGTIGPKLAEEASEDCVGEATAHHFGTPEKD
jgi:hypothetical protein